jgi:hypothetical protein
MTELAHRNSDNIDVSLFWDSETDELLVTVDDARTGTSFSLPAVRDRALDVFNHPFAYQAAQAAFDVPGETFTYEALAA